jgi:FG-GAP-like repeat
MSHFARKFFAAAVAMTLSLLPAANGHAQNVSFTTLPAMQVTTPIPQRNSAPNDFNGDGLSEILWYNPNTSQLQFWSMGVGDGSTVQHLGTRTVNVTAGYYVAATGDFNGDGLTDIVFTSANRDLYLWKSNGQGGFQSTRIDNYPAGWIPIGAGDVDGDGSDDLLWFNASSCQFGYWLMKNGVRVLSQSLPVTCGYTPLSIGYYALSNRISIVWTSAAHDLVVWDGSSAGFAVSSLGSYASDQPIFAFGGGNQGSGMSLSTLSNPSGFAEHGLTRSFTIGGKQSSFIAFPFGDGGMPTPAAFAGYFVRGQGVNKAGVMYQRGATALEVCPPSSLVDGILYEMAPPPGTCSSFGVDSGWIVVGMGTGTGTAAGIH